MGNQIESTGINDLDEKLGGLFLGDNVIIEAVSGTFPELYVQSFVRKSLVDNHDVVYISFNSSPLTLCEKFERLNFSGITVLDCFTAGKGNNEKIFQEFYENKTTSIKVIKVELPDNPNYFHRIFDEISEEKGNYTRYIFDSVTGMMELWKSEDKVKEFYTHTCPMLFDVKTIAYWILKSQVHSTSFIANLEHIGQVTIELNRKPEGLFLRVKKAVERYGSTIYEEQRYDVVDSTIRFL